LSYCKTWGKYANPKEFQMLCSSQTSLLQKQPKMHYVRFLNKPWKLKTVNLHEYSGMNRN
jgi:hypothetical protein